MKTILSIDDKKFNQVVLKDIIENIDKKKVNHNNFRFIEAYSGEEGINISLKETPDLILVDINMPKMSGIETTKMLKKINQTRHIPIVAITAQSMPGDRELCLSAGCNEFFSKPLNVVNFLNYIVSIIGKNL